MSTTLTVPEGFQYVGGALLSTVFVLVGQSLTVGRMRKRAQVKYPQMYAEAAVAEKSKDALVFNCAQRAHQNTLENVPIVAITTVIAGLKHPIFAASACAYWSFSRVLYTRGYVTGEPSKRNNIFSTLGSVGLLGLLLTSCYNVGTAIYSGL